MLTTMGTNPVPEERRARALRAPGPQLERLCHYLMRPPLSQERLTLRDDGRLELTLKSVWKDGTRALVLEPHDLLVRLCTAVPPPWFNMIRYFGVLSSHSRQRAEVCPKAQAAPSRFAPDPASVSGSSQADDRGPNTRCRGPG